MQSRTRKKKQLGEKSPLAGQAIHEFYFSLLWVYEVKCGNKFNNLIIIYSYIAHICYQSTYFTN